MATLEENLSPEVLEKVKASLAVTSKVKVTTADTEAANDEVNVDAFFGNISKEDASLIRPEDIEKKDQEVSLALKECDALIQEADKFHQNFVVRGNLELYKLLSSIYAFVLKVRLSEYRHHVMVAMISTLKDRGIKVQENTSELMVIIKYILGGDRKKAVNYCRVLEIATKENLAAKDLPDYITRRGGIGQIYATELDCLNKHQGAKVQERRLDLFREMLICKEWESNFEVAYPNDAHLHSDEIDCKRSDFVFLMTRYDKSKGVYKVLHAHKFGEKFENHIIRFMTRGTKMDVEKLESNLRNYCQKLVDKKIVPDVIARIWQSGRLQAKIDKTIDAA
jgi:hypothetical protein